MLRKASFLLLALTLLALTACATTKGISLETTTQEPNNTKNLTTLSTSSNETTADPDHGEEIPLSFPSVEWNTALLAHLKDLIAPTYPSANYIELPISSEIGAIHPTSVRVYSQFLKGADYLSWEAGFAEQAELNTMKASEVFDYTDNLVILEEEGMLYVLICMEAPDSGPALTKLTGAYLQNGVLHFCMNATRAESVNFAEQRILTVAAFEKNTLHGKLYDLELHFQVEPRSEGE